LLFATLNSVDKLTAALDAIDSAIEMFVLRDAAALVKADVAALMPALTEPETPALDETEAPAEAPADFPAEVAADRDASDVKVQDDAVPVFV